MSRSKWMAGAVYVAGLIALSSSARASECADLAMLTLPDMTVSTATPVAAGSLPVDAGGGRTTALQVPAFCRVTAKATPKPDSTIGFEVWLPEQGWNGKLLGIGNGGYSSVLNYAAMADGLRRGYAVTATDQGHQGEDLQFVIGHPHRIDDWSWRAIHLMTVGAKAIVRDATGHWPRRAYFDGCSTGGFQGMNETQRFPDDYDGVIAGAPGYPRTALSASFLYAWIVNHDAQGHEILPASKLPLLNRAVLAACDAQDGVKDGLIADPRACRFEPASLQCKGADAETCLTAAQVEVVRKVYAGPHNPRTGKALFTGWDRGSEAPGGDPKLGWTAYIVGQPEPVRLELWKYWLFGDAKFDWHTFDFDRDMVEAARAMPAMNAVSPDLGAFAAHGGKLLMYFGWADNVSSARTGIDYYESVERAVGERARTQSFLRLFLLPGMSHCKGGPGPNEFDRIGILDHWVESGQAPERIVASHSTAGKVDRTRPVCPYPQAAKYTGKGSIDDAANFVCAPASAPAMPDEGGWLQRMQSSRHR